MADGSIEELIRAREVQNEAMAEVNTRIQACKESMYNYECLSQRIMTLPDKLSHPIMVPFGMLAFMPGKIVHTNELLVHLGDAWFAEMSCKQALKVIELRQKNLQSSLTDLKKVSENIQVKSEYLSKMENVAKGRDEVEIKEESSSPYIHPKDRRRISRMKEMEKSQNDCLQEKIHKNTLDKKTDENLEHEALMQRLDELDRLEEEEDELLRLSSDEDTTDQTEASKAHPKHVTWKDQDQGELADEPKEPPEPCTIRFKHTKIPTQKKTSDMTPADVHDLVAKKTENKSILKTFNSKNGPGDFREDTNESATNEVSPVSELVIERQTERDAVRTSTSQPRPVSRFKAGRKKFGK